MSVYKFVHDKEQINRFQKIVYNSFENGKIHQICISARKKYGGNVKQGSFHFHHLLIDKVHDDEDLYRQVRKLEIPDDCYLDNDRKPFDQNCLSIYTTLTPRNSHQVIEKIYSIYIDRLKESVSSKLYPQIAFKKELNSNISKCLSKDKDRFLIQFDIDTKKKEVVDYVIEWLKERKIPAEFTTETHGGYHIIVDRKKIPNKFQNDLTLFSYPEVELLDSSHLLTIPGTFQANFPVRFADEITSSINT